MSEIEEKVRQIIGEMKSLGLWIKERPEWVTDYEKRSVADFTEWLQFVFLPNCLQEAKQRVQGRKQIVLQVKQFLTEDVQKGKLLQLLIELDALV